MRWTVLIMVMLGGCTGDEDDTKATTVIGETRTEISVTQVETGKAFRGDYGEPNLKENDLDFDYEDPPAQSNVRSKSKPTKEQIMQNAMLQAMKKPEFRHQIGQVIPILRAMSPTQRLTLAALVSSQIMAPDDPVSQGNLTYVASMFAGERVDNIQHSNISEKLLLPISMDIAHMFRGLGKEVGRSLRNEEKQPVHLVNRPGRRKKVRIVRRPVPTKPSPAIASRRSDQDIVPSDGVQGPVAEALRLRLPSPEDCEYFSNNVCLEVSDYPKEAIMRSIKKHKEVIDTLLADFKIQSADANVEGVSSKQEDRYQPQHYYGKSNRRQDTVADNEVRDFGSEGGYMCPSAVKYARPKRARTTSGQWKFIVNTGEYTQTLRMEMCLKPLSPCSYVTDNFRSQCSQVYNYHRLLTWDENKSLHMDIFKVPSCCSCHIQGYATLFPPHADFTYIDTDFRREASAPASPGVVLEGPYHHIPEPVSPPYNPNFANKREIPRPFQEVVEVVPSQETREILTEAETHNLVDHLVPPRPFVPQTGADSQTTFIRRANVTRPTFDFTNRGGKPIDYVLRRSPKPTEMSRITTKVTERADFGSISASGTSGFGHTSNFGAGPSGKPGPSGFGASGFGVKIRTKPPNATPPRPSSVVTRPRPTPTRPSLPSRPSKTPLLFVTPQPNHELVIQPGSKPNSQTPAKYFDPDTNDVKSHRPAVQAKPPKPPKHSKPTKTFHSEDVISMNGAGKRVNYNYHPIIDFFTPDHGNKNTPPPTHPTHAAFTSHEWTPLVVPDNSGSR